MPPYDNLALQEIERLKEEIKDLKQFINDNDKGYLLMEKVEELANDLVETITETVDRDTLITEMVFVDEGNIAVIMICNPKTDNMIGIQIKDRQDEKYYTKKWSFYFTIPNLVSIDHIEDGDYINKKVFTTIAQWCNVNKIQPLTYINSREAYRDEQLSAMF